MAQEMARLVKIDRNGSKHFEGNIVCDRCGGAGYYVMGMNNGCAVLSPRDGGVCWKCHGTGTVFGKWIERTPEYQAKLDAKREAKAKAKQAEWEANAAARAAEKAKREAEREAQIKAEKAVSQYVGQVGERVEFKGRYCRTGSWERKSFKGWGTETVYVHTFKDGEGNVFTWKTQSNLCMERDELVIVKGTIKAHAEYKDEKQTELTRCKVDAA